MNDDVYAMVNAIESIERLNIADRNGLYRQIHQLMESYLDQFCDHHIVTDLIDITPDRSQTIRYCLHCQKTYD